MARKREPKVPNRCKCVRGRVPGSDFRLRRVDMPTGAGDLCECQVFGQLRRLCESSRLDPGQWVAAVADACGSVFGFPATAADRAWLARVAAAHPEWFDHFGIVRLGFEAWFRSRHGGPPGPDVLWVTIDDGVCCYYAACDQAEFDQLRASRLVEITLMRRPAPPTLLETAP